MVAVGLSSCARCSSSRSLDAMAFEGEDSEMAIWTGFLQLQGISILNTAQRSRWLRGQDRGDKRSGLKKCACSACNLQNRVDEYVAKYFGSAVREMKAQSGLW